MSSEIVLDVEIVTEKLRDRIRSSFLDMIPEESWDKIIKKEFDEYFTRKVKVLVQKGYGGNKGVEEMHHTEFERVFADVFNEECDKYLREYFRKDEVKERIGEMLNTHLENAIPRIADSMLKDLLKTATRNLVENVTQNISYAIQDSVKSSGY